MIIDKALLIVGSVIFISPVISVLFIKQGKRKWDKMTDEEKLKHVNKWRSVGV